MGENRMSVKAFVGQSFLEDDAEVVRIFTSYLDKIQNMDIGFSWDHAENAEAKELGQKVREKMEDKNTFIGICTLREHAIDNKDLCECRFLKKWKKLKKTSIKTKTSDWILQEIGFAVAKNMSLVILLEEGLREPGGIQGNVEYISFSCKSPSEAFPKLLDMIHSLRPTSTKVFSSPSMPEAKPDVCLAIDSEAKTDSKEIGIPSQKNL
jgi:hypothetical protein